MYIAKNSNKNFSEHKNFPVCRFVYFHFSWCNWSFQQNFIWLNFHIENSKLVYSSEISLKVWKLFCFNGFLLVFEKNLKKFLLHGAKNVCGLQFEKEQKQNEISTTEIENLPSCILRSFICLKLWCVNNLLPFYVIINYTILCVFFFCFLLIESSHLSRFSMTLNSKKIRQS